MNKQVYRDIEEILREIDHASETTEMLSETLRALVKSCAEEYGIESGRLYRETGSNYVLVDSTGEFGEGIIGKTIPRDYPVIKTITKDRVVLITQETPGFDQTLEDQFTHFDYAAIMVGGSPSWLLTFGIRRETDNDDDLHFILETIRAAVGLKIRQSNLESQIKQARTIQMSLLPRHLPTLPGFDLAAITIPAEEVGGDVYDCRKLDEGVLGITLADASGHGLPAALQARDVVTGLRMGIAQDQKINTTVQKLNKVINQSGLSSRFVSLFYGELEETGNLVYVNGGHCPPLLFNPDGNVFDLPSNGPVLGPVPEFNYRRSYVELRPGEVLVIFSDGVIERLDKNDEDCEFGTSRLVKLVQSLFGKTAQEIVDTVISEVKAFGGNTPFDDDVTLFVARRLPADEFTPKQELGTVVRR
ncbi:MAG: PP2C family protein-serine/threonine phosphatase [bacterium]|nr:PP2C family protein-serine/threonine phosphatase [bacterium]MCP4800988.1 PP2C family protein-serine/threonine phosphatase [bacterium]